MTAWDPPTRLVLAWNILERPGSRPRSRSGSRRRATGTRVELEHRGWEALAEGAAEKRADYDTGWEHVLGRYVEADH